MSRPDSELISVKATSNRLWTGLPTRAERGCVETARAYALQRRSKPGHSGLAVVKRRTGAEPSEGLVVMKASVQRQARSLGGSLDSNGVDTERRQRLDELMALGERELRGEWRRLYRTEPPRLSRDLLMRGVAYRIQELALGGLSKAALRRLAAFEKELSGNGDLASVSQRASLRPGTRLLREWRGQTHAVIVVDGGFEYAGSVYPSLTRIAEKITGTHWSGPRFFGIGAKPSSSTPTDLDDGGDSADTAPAPELGADREVARA